MRFGLTKMTLGFTGFIELTEEEFKTIKGARDRLFEVLFLEEKFDFVTENYLEYETEILASAARFMVFRDQDYDWMHKERNVIARRIINLLTACRLYLDHSMHHLHNILGEGTSLEQEILDEKHRLYDEHFGYRVMEALRNYVQHKGAPVHSNSFSAPRVEKGDIAEIAFTAIPTVRVSYLEDDESFKKRVLEEMRLRGDEHDLRPLVREYVACLSKVHVKIRDILRKDINTWEQVSLQALQRFSEVYGPESIGAGIHVVTENEDGNFVQHAPIFNDFIERRKKLERKNWSLDNLQAQFVTGQVKS